MNTDARWGIYGKLLHLLRVIVIMPMYTRHHASILWPNERTLILYIFILHIHYSYIL